MEKKESNTISFLVIGGIIAVIIAYYVGISDGKTETQNNLSEQYSHTNEDFDAMEACYQSAIRDKEEVKSIVRFKGNGDDYDELTSAISEVYDIVGGKTVSVPKVSGKPESGYYDCE